MQEGWGPGERSGGCQSHVCAAASSLGSLFCSPSRASSPHAMEEPILRFRLRPPHTTQKTEGGGAGGQAGAASYRQPDSPACHPRRRRRRRLWLGGGLIWLRARQGPREPFLQLSLRQLRSPAETHTSLFSFQTWLEERRKSCCVLLQLINAAGLLELSGNDANNGRPPASRTQRTQARRFGSAR